MVLLPAVPAGALEALDEATLSAVHAQDGISLEITNNNAISASSVTWFTDNAGSLAANCTGGDITRQACVQMTPALAGVNGAPLRATVALDAGSAGGLPHLRLGLDWDPALLRLSGLKPLTPTVDYSARSLGTLGLYSAGHLYLTNRNGWLNSGGNFATLDFATSGDLIYRQGAAGQPELSFGNLQFSNRFTTGAASSHATGPGRIGIDNQGLIVSAPYARSDLTFDLMFKAAPTDLDRSGRSPMIRLGWTGGLVNPEVRVRAGGIGFGTYAAGGQTLYDISGSNGGGARSEGLNVVANWDFDADFAWTIGQAGGNGTSARLTGWRRLGPTSATPMLSMPITLDVLQNGVGPAGLCFGGGFASGSPVAASCTAAGGTWVAGGVPAGQAAFAALIRDGHLHAYNQQIEVRDPTSATPTSVYDWSLLYTLGKLDADVLLYPEGRAPGVTPTGTGTGLKADITLTAQSPGHWAKANSASAAVRTTAGAGWATNTHFMVADTRVGGVTGQQYGVGLVNADLLWATRNLYFRVVGTDSGYPLMPGGLWLQTDTSALYQFRGVLGGGNLLDLSAPTGVALLDLRLSTNRFIFALSPVAPVAGDAPIGFAGLLDLDGSAYLSLGEVSSPSSTFRLYDLQGRIGWRNGTVNLVSGQNSADGLPRLSISNDLLFGSSANFSDPGAASPTGGGAPLIGRVGFGSENFGRFVLPAGTWHSEVSLKIPGS
jgi:hypothetical protein